MNSCRKTALAAAICTALGAGHAGAATFSVTNTDDDGAGSLRDALTQADLNGEADTIDLSSISGQTISLSSGPLTISEDDVTINGAGVTVDASQANSRVLEVFLSDVTINDLTITGGTADGQVILDERGIGAPDGGGGIVALDGRLELNNAVVSGNSAEIGGGVYFYSYSGSGGLAVSNSTISGNDAARAGGGVAAYAGSVEFSFSGTTISGNTAGDFGGGIATFSYYGQTIFDNSVVSGNSVIGDAGPVSERREQRAANRTWAQRDDSRGGIFIGPSGGGADLFTVEGGIEIRESTISGNSAPSGGGLAAYGASYYGEGGSVLVDSSTISGNEADFAGGAILNAKYNLQVTNSTISGNTAVGEGGGLVMYSSFDDRIRSNDRGISPRNIRIDFTTITGNSASDIGGLAISSDIEIPITASVISGNAAPTDPDIGFEPETFAEAGVAFSLVGEDSTSGTLNLDTASSTLLGQDPQLGPLADNGGPTFTHLPAAGSPVVDAVTSGAAGCGDVVTDDQRGETRPSGAGCEAGSVERGDDAPPEALAVPVMDRIGLLLMAGLLGLVGLFGFRRRSEQES